jgi:hypothetical protein
MRGQNVLPVTGMVLAQIIVLPLIRYIFGVAQNFQNWQNQSEISYKMICKSLIRTNVDEMMSKTVLWRFFPWIYSTHTQTHITTHALHSNPGVRAVRTSFGAGRLAAFFLSTNQFHNRLWSECQLNNSSRTHFLPLVHCLKIAWNWQLP